MKKIFTLVCAILMAGNMMAQMHGAMNFSGASSTSVLTANNTSESDTIQFAMTSGTTGDITFPTMQGMATIPSFTVKDAAFTMDQTTHLVTLAEQDFSTTTTNAAGEEKAVNGKLSGSYSMAENKMSLKAVFKYGSMPYELTYTVDAYYIKPETATPLYVSVGGVYNFQNASVTYNVRKYKDGEEEKVDVEIPTYTLDGTVMGDLTLGTYTVKGLTYNEEKGGYYHDYANDGLTFHFTAVSNGMTTMDKDYQFNAAQQNDILVKYNGTAVADIVNTFQMGSMPFQIVSRFTNPTAGISSVNATETAKGNKAYSLSGQQVGSDYKGVVIINGKKFLQK